MRLLLQRHLFTVVFRVFLYVTNNFHVVLCRPSHKILASPLVTHSSAGRLWLAALLRWILFLTYQQLFQVSAWLKTLNVYHHHTTTVLRPFFQDHPGQPVQEENFWTLWCKGRLTEADTLTIQLCATPPPPSSIFFYGPDALPAAQPTVSKHWRQNYIYYITLISQQNNSTPKMILKIHQLWTLLDTIQNKRMWYIPEGNTDSRWMSPVAVRSCY